MNSSTTPDSPAGGASQYSAESSAEPQAAELLQKIATLGATRCSACDGVCCGHEYLLSIALGAARAPQCAPCLAKSLSRSTAELLDDMLAHFRRRACYGEAWNTISAREDSTCRHSRRIELAIAPTTSTELEEDSLELPHDASNAAADSFWDAGDLACGDLLLQLRQRLRAMASDTVIDVIARDRGAIEDLPAWCRLTGHSLLAAAHPRYRIRRKTD